VLALVAIATAWERLPSREVERPAVGTLRHRLHRQVRSQRGFHRRGQELVLDVSVFTAWLQATAAHNSQLAALAKA
jgi:hypothetical protein